MKKWKMAVWLMAFCFIFTGLAEAGKGKRKEKEKKETVVSVQKEISIYTPYTDRMVGSDPYRGSLPEALNLMNFSKEAAEALIEKVDNGQFRWGEIRSGETFYMTSGKGKVKLYVAQFKKDLKVRLYSASGEDLLFIPNCGNWVAYYPPKKKVEPPRIAEAPKPEPMPFQPPIEKPKPMPVPVAPQPVPEKPTVVEMPKPAPAPKPAEKREKVLEHEPIAGVYLWQNDLARGWGGFGEYVVWLRDGYPNGGYALGWSPGVGIYGFYSEGESRTNSYKWLERGFGPEIGLKYLGETKEGKSWSWQAKGRLAWEHMAGGNNTGYRMSQDNLKVGLYTEFIKQADLKGDWLYGATLEGWYAIDRERTSTWSGDTPSDRTQIALNFLVQRKINDDWQVRVAGGPFYQGWDELYGVRLLAEARYKETLMFGPMVTFFPFGLSSVYNGISAGSLTTLTGFVRLELGTQIRKWDAKRRAERVKQTQNPLNERKEVDKL